MNPEIKQQWIAALKSGNYQQGKQALRNGDKYCCLGVLCDIYSKEKNIEWQETISAVLPATHKIHESMGNLPDPVLEWANIDAHVATKGHDLTLRRRVNWNDNCGLDFEQIAQMIEKEL